MLSTSEVWFFVSFTEQQLVYPGEYRRGREANALKADTRRIDTVLFM